MGMGGSTLTKKELKAFQDEYEALKTSKQRYRFFAKGYVDAIELMNIRTRQKHWYAMINGFRFMDKNDKPFKDRDSALIGAIEVKRDFARKAK